MDVPFDWLGSTFGGRVVCGEIFLRRREEEAVGGGKAPTNKDSKSMQFDQNSGSAGYPEWDLKSIWAMCVLWSLTVGPWSCLQRVCEMCFAAGVFLCRCQPQMALTTVSGLGVSLLVA